MLFTFFSFSQNLNNRRNNRGFLRVTHRQDGRNIRRFQTVEFLRFRPSAAPRSAKNSRNSAIFAKRPVCFWKPLLQSRRPFRTSRRSGPAVLHNCIFFHSSSLYHLFSNVQFYLIKFFQQPAFRPVFSKHFLPHRFIQLQPCSLSLSHRQDRKGAGHFARCIHLSANAWRPYSGLVRAGKDIPDRGQHAAKTGKPCSRSA